MEIDAALLLGRPLRAIAAEFRVSRSSLHRHSKHVQGAAKRALERVTVAYSRHLQAYMRRVQEETLQILSAARVAGKSDLALQAIREARQNADTMRKLLVKDTAGKTKAKAATWPPDIEIHYEERPRVVE